MGEWSNLTAQQKAAVIKFALDNGVSDIKTIRDTYDIYSNELKDGGSIRIKHPGRLTALKERTGKTEAELWAEGKPSVRKMVTFARNARKWHKGADGMYLDTDTSREFLPNANIQNRQAWLYKTINGERSRYATRSGIVNLQDIQEALDYNGADTQYIWDSPEHESYTAYYRNPNYRAPVAENLQTNVEAIKTSKPSIPSINTGKFLPSPPSFLNVYNVDGIGSGDAYTAYYNKDTGEYKIENVTKSIPLPIKSLSEFFKEVQKLNNQNPLTDYTQKNSDVGEWFTSRYHLNSGGYLFKEGGKIHIAPSKRGTFTAAATKHGKSVQEFARQVLANKNNYSPAMVKKAVFAHNSKSWNHSDGGYLIGGIYDVDENEYNRLLSLGYGIEII